MGTIKQEEQLERIASALEGMHQELGSMNVHLESIDSMEGYLKELADCVGCIPPNPYQKEGHHVFRIEGSVYNE